MKRNILFNDIEDFMTISILNSASNKLDLYAVGYKQAADLLIETIKEGKHLDTLVYPILFLYRHYLELRLKEIIKQGRTLLDSEPKYPTHHELKNLWSTVREIITKIWSDSREPKEFKEIHDLTSSFSNIDSNSETFRYPEDKNGKIILNEASVVDVLYVKNKVEVAANFLEGVSMGISAYLDEKREAERQDYY